MKTSIVLLFLLGSFLSPSEQDPLRVSIKAQGAENSDLAKDGVKPSEMAQITIDVNEGSLDVRQFEIIHARGKSPINRARGQGNTFDLGPFRYQARAGDRLVIEIKSLVDERNAVIEVRDVVVTIPII